MAFIDVLNTVLEFCNQQIHIFPIVIVVMITIHFWNPALQSLEYQRPFEIVFLHVLLLNFIHAPLKTLINKYSLPHHVPGLTSESASFLKFMIFVLCVFISFAFLRFRLRSKSLILPPHVQLVLLVMIYFYV